jgi:hypothetical protein
LPSDPFRSTKVSLENGRLVTPGEPFLFFDSGRDTALFYDEPESHFLSDPAQLIQHLMSSKAGLPSWMKITCGNLRSLTSCCWLIAGNAGL